LSQIAESSLWYIPRQTNWLEKKRMAAQAQAFVYIPQRNAGVCKGASHSASIEGSAAQTVIEQPAISSDVTYDPVR
jgi:hypothetical protein